MKELEKMVLEKELIVKEIKHRYENEKTALESKLDKANSKIQLLQVKNDLSSSQNYDKLLTDLRQKYGSEIRDLQMTIDNLKMNSFNEKQRQCEEIEDWKQKLQNREDSIIKMKKMLKKSESCAKTMKKKEDKLM